MNKEPEVFLQHFKENVWLKRVSSNKKDHMQMVSVCIRLEDGSLAALGFLHYYNGIYYLKNESIGTIDDISFLNYIEKITGMNKSGSVKADVTFEEVCKEFKNTNSIRKTAKNVGLSEEKTKKIVISAGLYTSEKHKEIKELLEKGKTIDEIAEQLQMTKKQIRVFLPYSGKP